jgi:hypothetical protein
MMILNPTLNSSWNKTSFTLDILRSQDLQVLPTSITSIATFGEDQKWSPSRQRELMD